jgi:hypothetical protein
MILLWKSAPLEMDTSWTVVAKPGKENFYYSENLASEIKSDNNGR